MPETLKLAAGAVSEMGEGLTGSAFAVDFDGRGCRDILYAPDPATCGAGCVLYRKRIGTELWEAPVPLPGILGHFIMPLEFNSGFRLLGYGADRGYHGATPFAGQLILYRRNGGGFAGQALPVEGRPLKEHFPGVNRLSISPCDGETGTDLVVCCNFERHRYWPDGQHGWRDEFHPNLGPGRSYDAEGRWKGNPVPTRIYLIRNRKGNRFPEYSAPEFLFGFHSFDICSDACRFDLDGDGRPELIFRRDVDTLYTIRPDEKGRYTATAQKLLRLERGYFETTLHPCDLDGDGRKELLISGNAGTVFFLKQNGGKWKEQSPLRVAGGDVRVETLAVPSFADFSGSGRADLIAGDSSGYLWYFKRTAEGVRFKSGVRLKANGKTIHHQAGYGGSIQGPNEARWGYLNPLACHWADERSFDIICNDIRGRATLYRGIGFEAGIPQLAAGREMTCDGKQWRMAWRSRFTLWSSGVLVAINGDGRLQFFLRDAADPCNVRSGELLRYTDGRVIPACGPNTLWGRMVPLAADWEDRGVTDLLIGGQQTPVFDPRFPVCGTCLRLRNEGTNQSPRFAAAELISAGETVIDLGLHQNAPCLLKEADGTYLICGAEDGKFYLWEKSTLLPADRPGKIWSGSRLV